MCYDVRHPFEFQLFRLFFAQKFYIWQLHRFFLLSRAATVYILNGLVHFMYVWNPLNIRNVWVNPSTNFIPTRWTFKYGKIVTRATTTTTKSLKLSFTPSLPLSHDFLWMRIKKIVNNIIYVTKLAIYIYSYSIWQTGGGKMMKHIVYSRFFHDIIEIDVSADKKEPLFTSQRKKEFNLMLKFDVPYCTSIHVYFLCALSTLTC